MRTATAIGVGHIARDAGYLTRCAGTQVLVAKATHVRMSGAKPRTPYPA
jgi:hypothetical protein